MTKIEVTIRVTGINYNHNFFLFFTNRSMAINTYFVKMLLKTILEMSYNTDTGVVQLLKEVSE